MQAQKSWKNIKFKIIKNKKSDYESQLLKLNSNKAQKYLKWSAKLKFPQTIKLVIDWYKQYYFKRKDLYKFSVDQLKKYMNGKN